MASGHEPMRPHDISQANTKKQFATTRTGGSIALFLGLNPSSSSSLTMMLIVGGKLAVSLSGIVCHVSRFGSGDCYVSHLVLEGRLRHFNFSFFLPPSPSSATDCHTPRSITRTSASRRKLMVTRVN